MSDRDDLEAMRRWKALEDKAAGRLQPIDLNKFLYAPTMGMSGPERVNAGVGKAFADIGRGAAQLVGAGPNKEEMAEIAARDEPLTSTPGGKSGEVLGNVAMMAPLSMVPGANTVRGAAGIGGLMGGLQMGSPTEKLINMGTGALIGGGVQGAASHPVGTYEKSKALAASLYRTPAAMAEPLYEGGQNKILSRVLNNAAGDFAPRAQANLKNSAQELVPGSFPTAGEAAGSGGIAALQRSAAAVDPEAYAQRGLDQNAARASALQSLTGTDGEREMFAQARDQTAGKLYKAAFKAGIPEKKLTPKVQAYIATLMDNPYVQETVPIAQKLAKADGIDITDKAGSLQGMHYMKLALDNQLGKAATSGLGRTELQKVATAKDQLVGLMQKLSPKYAEAMAEFQAGSKPINQMDIGEEVFRRSTSAQMNSRGDPTVFPEKMAGTLKNADQVAAAATGFKKARMTDILEPEQLAKLQAVAADLSRSKSAQDLGRGAGSDTTQKLAMANLAQQSGVPLNVIRAPGVGRVGDWLYERADEEMRRKLSSALLDPAETARLMSQVTPRIKVPEASKLSRDRAALLARALVTPTLIQPNQ